MKKPRITYALLFTLLLLTEVLIALFIHDDFIRPYVGDMLVTVLICCFVRIFLPKGLRGLPVYVFIFAALVEVGQYFDFVKLLGLHHSKFFSVLLGRSFSALDLVCYALGCLVFFAGEHLAQKRRILHGIR